MIYTLLSSYTGSNKRSTSNLQTDHGVHYELSQLAAGFF